MLGREKITRKHMNLQNVDGFLLSPRISVKNFQEAVAFRPKADDIFIVGYPKSGTTWTQFMLWEIINRGAPLPNINDMWLKEVPHIDLFGTEGVENLKSPRLLKMNLPVALAPYHPSAKYIYVFRNPWDCCISGFNYFRQVYEHFSDGTFDEFFECFIRGELSHGDYFDHLLSWYTRWNDPNVLFLNYEGMKRDTRNTVLKTARFLGHEYYETLTKNGDVLENILRQIQFDYMKSNCPPLMVCGSTYSRNNKSGKPMNFFNSGKIGQWKNYFSEDQKQRLKDKFLRKLSGTKIVSMWNASDLYLE